MKNDCFQVGIIRRWSACIAAPRKTLSRLGDGSGIPVVGDVYRYGFDERAITGLLKKPLRPEQRPRSPPRLENQPPLPPLVRGARKNKSPSAGGGRRLFIPP